ncbi:APC family permease [Kitasatospora paranensis]|uniref:APC family permease n=1 Tax=Kitasatospora paranensis TaxID=258053 RepID=A0ABW2G5F3_9ACTN
MQASSPTTPPQAAQQPDVQLRQVVGPLQGAVIAMSSTAPTLSIGIGMGVIAAVVGGAVPAMVILAFLPILGIASAYAQLNSVQRNLGTGFVWVRRAFGAKAGSWLGFQSAWVTVVGTTIYLAYGSQVCGAMVLTFAGEMHLHSVIGLALDPGSIALTTVLGLIVLALLTWGAIRGANVAARFQTWLILFEYAVLIGFCGYAVIVGTHPFSLSWFNPASVPSLKLLVTGLVVSVYIFWGWDSVYTVTEETRNPRDAARAGFGSLWLMLGMFLLAALGFERLFSVPQMTQNASSLLPYLGTALAKQPIAALPLLALLFSSIASLQAGVLPIARQTLAMGREGALGPVWTRLHPRYATPAVGTLLLCSIAALLAVLAIGVGTLNQFIAAAATAVGMLVSLYYGLAGLACALHFRDRLRAGVLAALRSVVLPALSAAVLFALGGFLAYTDWTSASSFAWNAANGRFLAAVPVAIVLAGVAFSAWAKWGRRSAYFQPEPLAPQPSGSPAAEAVAEPGA